MDTWFVGRQPIGLYKQASTKGSEDSGVKVMGICAIWPKTVDLMTNYIIDIFHEGSCICWSS